MSELSVALCINSIVDIRLNALVYVRNSNKSVLNNKKMKGFIDQRLL